MKKIGEFIYPWGNGHYSRMMKLDEVLPTYLTEEYEMLVIPHPASSYESSVHFPKDR
jgi:hypothetical protein